jgi:hypothetical protein
MPLPNRRAFLAKASGRPPKNFGLKGSGSPANPRTSTHNHAHPARAPRNEFPCLIVLNGYRITATGFSAPRNPPEIKEPGAGGAATGPRKEKGLAASGPTPCESSRRRLPLPAHA